MSLHECMLASDNGDQFERSASQKVIQALYYMNQPDWQHMQKGPASKQEKWEPEEWKAWHPSC